MDKNDKHHNQKNSNKKKGKLTTVVSKPVVKSAPQPIATDSKAKKTTK